MKSAAFIALTAASCLATAAFASSSMKVEDHTAMGDWDTLYPRYPACRRGREFAIVVPETERVTGQMYYERVKSDGKVKYYFCASCSVCANYGLATASPCAERTNTECSLDCLVPGCVFDEASAYCRLSSTFDTRRDVHAAESSPGSCGISPKLSDLAAGSNQLPVQSDGREAVSTEQVRLTHAETIESTQGPETAYQKLHTSSNEGAASQPLGRSEESQGTPRPVFTWTASEALFVGMGIVTAVLVLNMATFMYIFNKKRQNKRQKREATKSTKVLYSALARARTDSNVTKESSCVSV